MIYALPAAAFALETFFRFQEKKTFPLPGEQVDVGGYRLHLNCTGEAKPGIPTVILESGLWCCSLDWQFIQPQISALTKVVSYDRAGYAWSEKGPTPRTFEQIVHELRIALSQKGISPPYLLVGHSSGGAIARYFQAKFPEEVVSLILIDSLVAAPKLSATNNIMTTVATRIAWFLAHFGLFRALSKLCVPITSNARWSAAKQYTYNACNRFLPKSFYTYLNEWDSFAKSFEDLKQKEQHLKNKHLIVICRGNEKPLIPMLSKEKNEEIYQQHLKEQKTLLTLSERAELRMANHSGHMVHLDEPEIVIKAIQDVLGGFSRFQHGS